ncbi:MAG: AAA family ATPase [Lentisphaerae bacterium]|nr:AAA family ATPase [Lentisphaerota bacterium]
MPNLPHGTSTDRSNLFRESGAEVLLVFGRVLIDLSQGMRPASCRTVAADGPVPGDVADCEAAVREFFESHPRARLRPLVASKARPKEIDLRVCRVVAALGALHVLDDRESVPILTLARICCPGGMPSDVLEFRRVIAALGVSETVQVADNAGLFAHVALGTGVLVELLGGAESIPIVGDTILAQLREQQGRHGSPARGKPQAAGRPTDAASFVRKIPLMRPREIFDELGKRGYVGQEATRRSLCVAAFRHVRRLRRVFLDGTQPVLLPGRENAWLRSEPGTGKTFMVRLLGEILALPHVVIDLTQYSETGYVGEEPVSILTRLILAAGNAAVAQVGVIALDEVDKIAEPPTGGRMSHVSRQGVQRSLLKLLEPGIIEVPLALGHPFRVPRVRFDTSNLWWIATGAFSGWEEAAGSRVPIGFCAQGRKDEPNGRQTVKAYSQYGLMPELLGRFPVWKTMDRLSRCDLHAILDRAVRLYGDELEMDGVGLRVDRDVLDLIVARAVERGTNARGLQAELCEAISDAAFEAYSDPAGATIRLHAESGDIRSEVTHKPKGVQMTISEVKAMVESSADQEAAR